ncbi:MAG: hypothetical protein FJ399_24390, partial [Verrucomicrobia bacterium]|nr:hypothetical protein [Verrucomicrobiota bacterium]
MKSPLPAATLVLLGTLTSCLLLPASLAAAQPPARAAAPWTDTQFPAHIRRLNLFGERPDW